MAFFNFFFARNNFKTDSQMEYIMNKPHGHRIESLLVMIGSFP